MSDLTELVLASHNAGKLKELQAMLGDRVRVLPNHACSTGAQHPAYHVVHGDDPAIAATWSRFGGW